MNIHNITFIFCLWIGMIVSTHAQQITGLVLINANTDQVIKELEQNAEIDLALTGENLNIQALTNESTASVKFEYDESNIGPGGDADVTVENTEPFAMRGDNSGNYHSWTPSTGTHVLTVTPYSESGASGIAGSPLILNFTVIEGDPPTSKLPDEPGSGVAALSGEQKKWHKITLSFDGPACNEMDESPNPFLDYRLNVYFSRGNKTLVVPGYFAADGNAAQSSATSGNVWRVHFSPDDVGEWQWKASFRTGDNIAVSTDSASGIPVPPLDGQSGQFNIDMTDKTKPDLRAKGRLEYVEEHYLRFAETGEYFIKGGPDSPENLLAYEDFDNTPNHGDRRKSWAPHAGDYQTGDPSWQKDKGTELIGAINYLARKGLNAFSFLTMNINGDDENVYPYVLSSDFTHFDCSKLDQWGIIFDHASRKGMYLHFKTQETENETLLDGGEVGITRKLYYRELVARFGYHLALNWNLGEENKDQTEQQRKDMAAYFHAIDPYHHHIVIHTYPGDYNYIYEPLMGNNSKLTGASVQTKWDNVHHITGSLIQKSVDAGKKWVVANDEQGLDHLGVPHDDYTGSPTLDDIRKQTLWGNLMAGGAGVEYYFGYSLPHSDMKCQDFKSRDKSWDFVRHAISFFQNNDVPFHLMSQKDNLVTSGWCLASEGQAYIVYLPDGGSANITLPAGEDFIIKWYDPRSGGNLQNGTVKKISSEGKVHIGNAPESPLQDWVVFIRHAQGINHSPTASIHVSDSVGEAPLKVVLDGSGSSDPENDSLSYSWNSGDGSISSKGKIVEHVFANPGTYSVTLTVTDKQGLSSAAKTTIIVNAASEPPVDSTCVDTAGPGCDTINPAAYELTVVNGSGNGIFTEGEIVNIIANSPPTGHAFDTWKGSTQYLDQVHDSSTTLIMPAENITLTASYMKLHYNLVVNEGTGSGVYEYNATIMVSANNPSNGEIFTAWQGDVDALLDTTMAETYLEMPASDITITPVYESIVSIDINHQYDTRVFPNPFSNYLTISSGSLIDRVELYTTTGKKILRKYPAREYYKMDLSHLQEGIYLLIAISGSGKVFVKKLLKQ